VVRAEKYKLFKLLQGQKWRKKVKRRNEKNNNIKKRGKAGKGKRDEQMMIKNMEFFSYPLFLGHSVK